MAKFCRADLAAALTDSYLGLGRWRGAAAKWRILRRHQAVAPDWPIVEERRKY
jgi:hypothetical protein